MFHGGVTYATARGYRPLLLDLHVPDRTDGPMPCVVWVHGGGWRDGDRRFPPEEWKEDLFAACVASGLAVATVDYRLSGEASFPAQLHDVKAAIRYLRDNADRYGIDPDRFGVWGESAGGHLAALVGLTADRRELEGDLGVTGPSSAVAAVVSFYGIFDLTVIVPRSADDAALQLLGASPVDRPDLAAVASPLTYVGPPAPAFLLVHGDSDSIVSHSQSVRLHEALSAAGVESELHVVPGAGHVLEGLDIGPFFDQAIAFLLAKLT